MFFDNKCISHQAFLCSQGTGRKMPKIPPSRKCPQKLPPQQNFAQQAHQAGMVPQLQQLNQFPHANQDGQFVQHVHVQQNAQIQAQNFPNVRNDGQAFMDGMVDGTKMYTKEQFNSEFTPDPTSYRLKQRRKAIRKPSLERQGGFEQVDENYASEQRRKTVMDATNHVVPGMAPQGNLTNKQPPLGPMQQAPYLSNAVSNEAGKPAGSGFNHGQFQPFSGHLNVSTEDPMRQDSFESFSNSAVPELEMDNTEVYYHHFADQSGKKENAESASMSNFQGAQATSQPCQAQAPGQPSCQSQQAELQPHQQQHPHRLQSQDTLSSDIVNLNYDNGNDWVSEDYLDQQFEENWSRRQAQFEGDMPQGPSSAANHDSGPFNAMQNAALGNDFMGGEMPEFWNNTAQQQQHQKNDFTNSGQKVDNMGNFYANLVEETNANGGEFTAPSIVISGSELNDRPAKESHLTKQTDGSTVPMEEEKPVDNLGMIFSDANGTGSNATKHIFGDEPNQFGGAPQHAQSGSEFSGSSMFGQTGTIEVDGQLGGVCKPETKSVKFSEEVDKKSPPHLTLGDSFFGSDAPLVVQTNTEGMSRARVRWINAFNKITSHLSEVCFLSYRW